MQNCYSSFSADLGIFWSLRIFTQICYDPCELKHSKRSGIYMKVLRFSQSQYLLALACALFFSASTLQASSFAVGVSVGIGYGGVAAKIPVGSKVVVHQPLAIAAGKARVYFQHGKMLNRIEDTYDPYCYFSMKRPRAEMQSSASISPATFTVTKQYRRKEQTAQRGIRLASSVSVGIGVGSNWWLARNEGGPQNLNHYLRLEPSDQPQVSALVCGIFAEPQERTSPSIEEMAQALGEFATIKTAQ